MVLPSDLISAASWILTPSLARSLLRLRLFSAFWSPRVQTIARYNDYKLSKLIVDWIR